MAEPPRHTRTPRVPGHVLEYTLVDRVEFITGA